MLVLLTSADFGLGYELTPVNKKTARAFEKKTGHKSVLIQTDWNFPWLAENLGMRMKRGRKGHECWRETDGTVNCSCGKGAAEFIAESQEWLDKRVDSCLRADVDAYFGLW